MPEAALTLRRSTPDDEVLLFRLFADNKAREMAALGLGEEQLRPLLAMQYRSRCATYASGYPSAEQLVAEAGSEAVGHMLLCEDEAAIQIVDIAIAPGYQSRGFGTALLRTMQERAAGQGKTVKLQVVPHSPAFRLYERLGFAVTVSDAMNAEMVWPADTRQGA